MAAGAGLRELMNGMAFGYRIVGNEPHTVG